MQAERAGGPPVAADPSAGEFDDFARREWPALVAFAWSLTGRLSTAEEVAQEAIAAAWRSWDQISRYDKPGAWARRVVANRSATARRSAGREERASLDWRPDGGEPGSAARAGPRRRRSSGADGW